MIIMLNQRPEKSGKVYLQTFCFRLDVIKELDAELRPEKNTLSLSRFATVKLVNLSNEHSTFVIGFTYSDVRTLAFIFLFSALIIMYQVM